MRPRNWWNIQNISDDEERVQATTLFLKDVFNILNKGFTLTDNAKGAFLTVTFSLADTDTQIRHGLDFVPTNYLLCGSSVAMSVYDGTLSPDKTFIYLKTSAAGSARLFVF